MRAAILSVLALCAMGLVGCASKPEPPSPARFMRSDGAMATPTVPVHHDWIEEMKAVARARHMRYTIFCTSYHSDNDSQFQAMLCSGMCASSEQHELREMTWQAARGATQEDAARNLMLLVSQNQWYYPEPPKPAEHYMEHKLCPPDIEGNFLPKERP